MALLTTGLAPVERADIIEAKEATLKETVAVRVFAIGPPTKGRFCSVACEGARDPASFVAASPAEVNEQLVKAALKEAHILAPPGSRDLVDLPARPRVHGCRAGRSLCGGRYRGCSRRPCARTRVQVIQRPLVRRQSAGGMHVPLAHKY